MKRQKKKRKSENETYVSRKKAIKALEERIAKNENIIEKAKKQIENDQMIIQSLITEGPSDDN